MVEFFKYAVEIVCDVISCIPNVTGIETDAEPFLAVYALDDGGDFLEAAPDLRSLARHGFQEHDRLLRWIENVVQKVCDKFDAFFCALPYIQALEKARSDTKIAADTIYVWQLFLYVHFLCNQS